MKKYLEFFNQSKTVTTLLLLAIFVFLNWASYALYWRHDISGNGRLRITGATKKILRNLPEQATLEAYFSSDVPDAHIQNVKQLRDFLKEYAGSSGGQINLVFLNPDSDQQARERAGSLGIEPMPIGSIDDKKQEVANVYFSVALFYGDRREVLPNILKTGILEYELTSRLYKMAYPGQRSIGFAAGQGQFSLQNDSNPFFSLNIINHSLEALYGPMVNVDLAQEIPAEITTLVLANPGQLSESELFHLDQFLMQGKSLLLAISAFDIDFNSSMAMPASPELSDLLKSYGLQIEPGMLFEPKNFIPLRQQLNMYQSLQIPYPSWVFVPAEGMNSSQLISKKQPGLFLPWAGEIALVAENLPQDHNTDKAVAVTLATSSATAWKSTGQLSIGVESQKNLWQQPRKADEPRGPFKMAVYLKGHFTSHFKNHPLPAGVKSFLAESVEPGHILAISSPFVLSDSAAQRSQGLNIAFVLSGVDVMNGLEELVEARNVEMANPPLPALQTWLRQALTLLNFVLPLAVIAAAGGIFFYRRRRLAKLAFSAESAHQAEGDQP